MPKLFSHVLLNDVFIPGGQPSITYVDRAHLGIEQTLKKAIALPNTIVSLTGPTKSGKTVLCSSVLNSFQYIWIDGGQIKEESDVWNKICSELRLATEISETETKTNQIVAAATADMTAGIPGNSIKIGITLSGSRLMATAHSEKFVSHNSIQAIDALIKHKICLVIDDFHYVDVASRSSLIRFLKGAVYRGLKVVLLSIPHRAFDATRAEVEVAGRFKHVTVPPWAEEDLVQIGKIGFQALNIRTKIDILPELAKESEGSPHFNAKILLEYLL